MFFKGLFIVLALPLIFLLWGLCRSALTYFLLLRLISFGFAFLAFWLFKQVARLGFISLLIIWLCAFEIS